MSDRADTPGDAEDIGRFCPWYPLERARECAPDAPGVYQIKRARGLIDYPRGKSAMVHYGHAASLCQELIRVYAAALLDTREPLMCRHQRTPDPDSAQALYQTLTTQFLARFGRAPGPSDP